MKLRPSALIAATQTLLSLSLLAGCTLEGDETAPTVTTQFPAAGSTSAPLDTTISINFSEAIFTDKLTTDSLVVTMNDVVVAGDLAYDNNNNQLLFTPQQPLPLFQTVTVNYGPGIVDLAQNPVANGSWQFTTIDGEWLASGELSLPGSDGSSASVMIDNSGYGIATWIQSDGLHQAVHAAHYIPGSGWNTPGIIDIFSSDDASSKVADINRETGTALVTWRESNGSNNQLWATLYTTANGWSAPEVVNVGSANNVESTASFFIAEDDSVDIVWTENNGTFTTVWTNHYDAGLGWSSPLELQTIVDQNAVLPKIHGNEAGQRAALWQQTSGVNQYSVFAATYDVTNGWTVQELEQSTALLVPGQIKMNDNGDAMAMWSPANGTDTNLRYSRLISGSWEANATAVDTAGELIQPTALFFNDDGSADIFYIRQTIAFGYSLYTENFDGSNWGNRVALAEDAANDNLSLSISKNSAGVIQASWTEFVGRVGDPPTESAIVQTRLVPGQSWETPQTLHFITGELSLSPSIALSESGETLLVWRQLNSAIPQTTIEQRVFAAP